MTECAGVWEGGRGWCIGVHSACLQLKNRPPPPPPPPPPLQRSIGPSVRIPIGSVRPIIRDVCNDGCIWNNGSAELTLGMIVVSDLWSGACLPGPATVGTMLAALPSLYLYPLTASFFPPPHHNHAAYQILRFFA